MRRIDADVLILGAGAAGLACRMGLSGRRRVLCVEASPQIGGLLRMVHRGAYSFDTTVHALSLSRPHTRALVESLVPDGFHVFRKRNLVWQRGRVIEYPYQFNAHALEPGVRDECVSGVPESAPAPRPWTSFEDWLLAQFGPGFYRHFFEPYNRKLYGAHPSQLEAAPMVWTIPADNRDAVLRGATAQPTAASMQCLYPRGRNGIEQLPLGLAERGRGEILCGQTIVEIDVGARVARTAGGLEIAYRDLVSTIPLPALLRGARGLPAEIADWAERLEARRVTVFQIEIERRGDALDADWTYFPDPEIPFYRLTRLERISPDLAPKGSSACLVECAGDAPPPGERVAELCRELGVAGPGAVRTVGQVEIPHAYVLFKRGHREASERAIRHLVEHGVHVAGRYGTWSYLNIDQTIESGLSAAGELDR